jgi:uncharacterized protein
MNFFRGCTALITGASSGIGAEIARQLTPYADRLILVARRLDRLEALRRELTGARPELDVWTYGVDLADPDRVDEMVHWLEQNGLRISFLVNNAGVGDHGPFATGDWARIQQMLDVNITALTQLTHHLLPHLRDQERPAILNVSSIVGMLPVPYETVYAATKAYVNSFSEGLRAELRTSGISVTTVCPGPVDTEFQQAARRPDGYSLPAPDLLKVPVEQVAGEALRAVACDRARVIPGLLVALIVTVAASVPLFALRFCMNRRVQG